MMPRLCATLCACLVALACPGALAGALQLPPPPPARFAPSAGARLPLDAVLRDETGKAAPLSAWFDGRPVVLVPGYYRCPNLCGTVFEGVLQALALGGLRGGEYRLLGVSIDPREDAAAAAHKHAAYANLLPAGAGLALLTGDTAALARIEAALGYVATPEADSGQIAHAAGFVVADKDGRILRHFPGVRFDPAALRDAVRAAREGAAPPAPSLGQRLLLLCAHYDPATGRNTPLALALVRAAALAVLAALLWSLWRWRARGSGGSGGSDKGASA
jgi:protein SCO1/2